jgi:hypothetical protein
MLAARMFVAVVVIVVGVAAGFLHRLSDERYSTRPRRIPGHRRGAVGDAGFRRAAGVGLDRAHADEELARHLGHRQPAGERLQHLPLTLGQHRAVVLGPDADLPGEPGRELGGNHRAAAGDVEHRLDDLRPLGVLREVPRRALLQRLEHHGAVGVRGEQQHPGAQPVGGRRGATPSPSTSGIL